MKPDAKYVEKYVKNGIEKYLISSSIGYKDFDNDVKFIILKVRNDIPKAYESALDVVYEHNNYCYRVILDKVKAPVFDKIDPDRDNCSYKL